MCAYETFSDLLGALGPVEKLGKTPSAKCLRENSGTPVDVSPDGAARVYPNGYCLYTNHSGSTCFFLAGVREYVYRDEEGSVETLLIKRLGRTCAEAGGGGHVLARLGKEELLPMPWYVLATMVGEDRVCENVLNRKGDRIDVRIYGSPSDGMHGDEPITWEEVGVAQESEDPLVGILVREGVRELLEALTATQARVAAMCGDGYSQTEVAGVLGTTPQAVHQMLKRARARVKSGLNPAPPAPTTGKLEKPH